MFSMRFLLAATALSTLTVDAKRQDPSCLDGIDIVQLQDMTSSFDPRWMPMAEQVGSVLDVIAAHPAARFSFSSFGDKPVSGYEQSKHGPQQHSLGYSSDYCLKVDASLDQPDVPSMVQLFKNYQKYAAGGGGDWEEGVLDAMQRTLLTKKIGWREPEEGKKVAKVMVLVTDAVAHIPGDAYKYTGHKLRPFDITEEDLLRHDDENFGCGDTDYPDFEKVSAQLINDNVWLLLMIAPGGTYKDGVFIPAASIAYKGHQYRGEDGLRKWYVDQFKKAGVRNLFATDIDFNMTQYSSAYIELLDELINELCPPTTTSTTPLPTTSITTSSTVLTTPSTTTSMVTTSPSTTVTVKPTTTSVTEKPTTTSIVSTTSSTTAATSSTTNVPTGTTRITIRTTTTPTTLTTASKPATATKSATTSTATSLTSTASTTGTPTLPTTVSTQVPTTETPTLSTKTVSSTPTTTTRTTTSTTTSPACCCCCGCCCGGCNCGGGCNCRSGCNCGGGCNCNNNNQRRLRGSA